MEAHSGCLFLPSPLLLLWDHYLFLTALLLLQKGNDYRDDRDVVGRGNKWVRWRLREWHSRHAKQASFTQEAVVSDHGGAQLQTLGVRRTSEYAHTVYCALGSFTENNVSAEWFRSSCEDSHQTQEGGHEESGTNRLSLSEISRVVEAFIL